MLSCDGGCKRRLVDKLLYNVSCQISTLVVLCAYIQFLSLVVIAHCGHMSPGAPLHTLITSLITLRESSLLGPRCLALGSFRAQLTLVHRLWSKRTNSGPS